MEKTFCENMDVVPKFLKRIHAMIKSDEVMIDSILYITEIIVSQVHKEHPRDIFEDFLHQMVTDQFLGVLERYLEHPDFTLLCLQLFSYVFKHPVFLSMAKNRITRVTPKRHISFSEEVK